MQPGCPRVLRSRFIVLTIIVGGRRVKSREGLITPLDSTLQSNYHHPKPRPQKTMHSRNRNRKKKKGNFRFPSSSQKIRLTSYKVNLLTLAGRPGSEGKSKISNKTPGAILSVPDLVEKPTTSVVGENLLPLLW